MLQFVRHTMARLSGYSRARVIRATIKSGNYPVGPALNQIKLTWEATELLNNTRFEATTTTRRPFCIIHKFMYTRARARAHGCTSPFCSKSVIVDAVFMKFTD